MTQQELEKENSMLRHWLAEEQQRRVDAESDVKGLKSELKMADMVIESLQKRLNP